MSSAAAAGQAPRAQLLPGTVVLGVTVPSDATSVTVSAVSSVSVLGAVPNSETSPVTSTESPIASVLSSNVGVNTKMASDWPGVASAPGVWR